MKSTKERVPGYPALRWSWYQLEKMKPALLYDLLALREAIFVVEQSCIYQELDGLDKVAQHLLLMQDANVVACLRVLPPGPGEIRVRIGRVAVSADWRNRGIARVMMHMAIDKSRLDYPSSGICLSAQTYLQEFYQSLGFSACGEEFLEDGIPHIPMQL